MHFKPRNLLKVSKTYSFMETVLATSKESGLIPKVSHRTLKHTQSLQESDVRLDTVPE